MGSVDLTDLYQRFKALSAIKTREQTLQSGTGETSKLITDDGARHAETLTRDKRMPLFETNKLLACEGVTFTAEHKRRALALLQEQ